MNKIKTKKLLRNKAMIEGTNNNEESNIENE